LGSRCLRDRSSQTEGDRHGGETARLHAKGFAACAQRGFVVHSGDFVVSAVSGRSRETPPENRAVPRELPVARQTKPLSIRRAMKLASFALVILIHSSAFLVAAEESAVDARLAQTFKNFDTNGDGGISLEEYRAGMAENMSPGRVERVFREKDRNHDGKLNIPELLYVPQDLRAPVVPKKEEPKSKAEPISNSTPAPVDARLAQTFRNFDLNKDGGISLDEYKAGMVGNMSADRVATVFVEKDRNRDGKLSMEELVYVPQDQRAPAGRK
jgi:Ca2+-binding EF-hand superfamily protein